MQPMPRRRTADLIKCVVQTFFANTPVPEIIDPVFAKSPKRLYSMTEYERFGLVFMKTRVYKFGHSYFPT
jgi:hypothetical protein